MLIIRLKNDWTSRAEITVLWAVIKFKDWFDEEENTLNEARPLIRHLLLPSCAVTRNPWHVAAWFLKECCRQPPPLQSCSTTQWRQLPWMIPLWLLLGWLSETHGDTESPWHPALINQRREVRSNDWAAGWVACDTGGFSCGDNVYSFVCDFIFTFIKVINDDNQTHTYLAPSLSSLL